jgi:hypothetical protein
MTAIQAWGWEDSADGQFYIANDSRVTAEKTRALLATLQRAFPDGQGKYASPGTVTEVSDSDQYHDIIKGPKLVCCSGIALVVRHG